MTNQSGIVCTILRRLFVRMDGWDSGAQGAYGRCIPWKLYWDSAASEGHGRRTPQKQDTKYYFIQNGSSGYHFLIIRVSPRLVLLHGAPYSKGPTRTGRGAPNQPSSPQALSLLRLEIHLTDA